jgi:predicted Zn-dependent protease
MNVTAVVGRQLRLPVPAVHPVAADGAAATSTSSTRTSSATRRAGPRTPWRSSPPAPVEPGRYDLVLLPSHLWLTIHESIAHPTELDRIMGFEANYAGTSFISPIEDYLGSSATAPTS